MRELPIIFSTPMVQAILEDRKFMTRRIQGLNMINITPDFFNKPAEKHTVNSKEISFLFTDNINVLNLPPFEVTPRYQKGDHMWVKETFHIPNPYGEPKFIYKADWIKLNTGIDYKWKSSLFMPKVAARIWLEVTNVRCERLLDISEEDSEAEGVKKWKEPDIDWFRYKDYTGCINWHLNARSSFLSLWRKINGDNSIKSNPWVFVYEFKRIKI